jgi:phage tail protein X
MSSHTILPCPDFARRRDNKGTVDSICLHCYAKIATSSDEAVLEAQEAAHFCWQRQGQMLRERLGTIS